jgi:NDP-sugar pyrophosphorylase family protein
MKAVILAAGEGIRMRPLTLETPKPMLSIAGQPILEHIIALFPKEITDIVCVVGYLGNKIIEHFGNEYQERKMQYVWQEKKLGTADALLRCKDILKNERFLLMYADDLHTPESIEQCLQYERSFLVMEHPDPRRFGVVSVDEQGNMKEIIEKPENPASNLVSIGVMVLDGSIFYYEPDLHPSGEWYLPTMINKMAKDYPISLVRAQHWFPIATPEHLAEAEKHIHLFKK